MSHCLSLGGTEGHNSKPSGAAAKPAGGQRALDPSCPCPAVLGDSTQVAAAATLHLKPAEGPWLWALHEPAALLQVCRRHKKHKAQGAEAEAGTFLRSMSREDVSAALLICEARPDLLAPKTFHVHSLCKPFLLSPNPEGTG